MVVNSCRSEEHTSELQSQSNIVCRLLLENKTPLNISSNISPSSDRRRMKRSSLGSSHHCELNCNNFVSSYIHSIAIYFAKHKKSIFDNISHFATQHFVKYLSNQ